MNRAPIPTPFSRRLLEIRQRYLPGVVFGGCALLVVVLWQKNLAVPALVGQAEPVVANVSSFRPGVLAELNVKRFQAVKAGDLLGKVLVPDEDSGPATAPGHESKHAPIILRAPMDGVVTAIHNHPGEAVIAGSAIVSIATLHPVRIVGYMRSPNLDAAKVGMKVQVRTRDLKRAVGRAEVLEVGTQLETVPPALASPIKLANLEFGLPVDISLPPNLAIRPGELVDVMLLAE